MSVEAMVRWLHGRTAMPLPSDLLTTTEVARELGLTLSGVRAAIHDGALAVVRIDGRTNAVTRAEVERYKREHRGRPGKRKMTDQQPPHAVERD